MLLNDSFTVSIGYTKPVVTDTDLPVAMSKYRLSLCGRLSIFISYDGGRNDHKK